MHDATSVRDWLDRLPCPMDAEGERLFGEL